MMVELRKQPEALHFRNVDLATSTTRENPTHVGVGLTNLLLIEMLEKQHV